MSNRTETREPGSGDPAALAVLERSFDGEPLQPGDVDYDDRRRVWNGSIDRRPSRSRSDPLPTPASPGSLSAAGSAG